MAAPTVACVVALTAVVVSLAPTVRSQPAQEQCPGLLAIGVQGPGQAAADTAATTDSGLLGEIFRPLVTTDDGAFGRVYVRFQADLNAVTSGGGPTPYERSVDDAAAAVHRTASEFLARCPNSHIAVVGSAHAAQVASVFARQVGRGGDEIASDRVAAVALFGDPTRGANTPLFPGASGQTRPDIVPGTAGQAMKELEALSQQPAAGGGISPTRTSDTGFGRLTRRVVSFCISGDLACDAPENAPILKVVSNIVGAASDAGGDPLRALASVTQALAFTAIKTATNVVNNDVQRTSLASLSLSPNTSLSQRMAEASDPRTPLDITNVLKAVLKVGTIAINAVVTVAKAVVTPTNIAEIAAAGLSDPVAGLAVLGQKLLGALPQLIPPSTGTRLVGQAFQAVVSNVTDAVALIDTTNWVKFSDTIAQQGAYLNTPVASTGQAPAKYVTDWFHAIAADIAATPVNPSRSARPSPTTSPASISASPGSTSTTTPPPSTSRSVVEPRPSATAG
ncbi:cutinase family protein [Nocardia sp. NPDC052278]|uniref:cutinase family protein n=1 Tax=unclassified Nocardia TaxID=2637762 RepID=UPI0036B412D2